MRSTSRAGNGSLGRLQVRPRARSAYTRRRTAPTKSSSPTAISRDGGNVARPLHVLEPSTTETRTVASLSGTTQSVAISGGSAAGTDRPPWTSIRRTVTGGPSPGSRAPTPTRRSQGRRTRMRRDRSPSETISKTSTSRGASASNGWVHRQVRHRATPRTVFCPTLPVGRRRRIRCGWSLWQCSQKSNAAERWVLEPSTVPDDGRDDGSTTKVVDPVGEMSVA